MTRRVRLKFEGPSCGENYTAYTYTSVFSGLESKETDILRCPKCGEKYNSEISEDEETN